MRNILRLFCSAFFWVAFLLPSQLVRAASVADDLQLELRADVVVTGSHILMSDLTSVASANKQLKDAVESMRVGNAPRVGHVERYTRAELEQQMRSRLIPYSGKIEWSGANAIKVRSAGQILPGDKLSEEIKEIVKSELKAKYASVELNSSSPLADVELPVGEVSWKLRPIDVDHLFSLLPVWVDVSVNKQPYRAVTVSFLLKLKTNVYVAHRDLPVGTVVATEDFEAKLEDVSDIAQEVMPIADVEMPARVKKAVKKGQILMRDQLSQQGMVFRGDSVKLMLTDGGLMIETRAIAEQDGNVGQLVKVKPETSDAAVTALIVAPGVVKVEGM